MPHLAKRSASLPGQLVLLLGLALPNAAAALQAAGAGGAANQAAAGSGAPVAGGVAPVVLFELSRYASLPADGGVLLYAPASGLPDLYFALTDAAGNPVPASVTQLHGGYFVLLPDSSLVVGQSYYVEAADQLYGISDAFSFSVAAAAAVDPLPSIDANLTLRTETIAPVQTCCQDGPGAGAVNCTAVDARVRFAIDVVYDSLDSDPVLSQVYFQTSASGPQYFTGLPRGFVQYEDELAPQFCIELQVFRVRDGAPLSTQSDCVPTADLMVPALDVVSAEQSLGFDRCPWPATGSEPLYCQVNQSACSANSDPRCDAYRSLCSSGTTPVATPSPVPQPGPLPAPEDKPVEPSSSSTSSDSTADHASWGCRLAAGPEPSGAALWLGLYLLLWRRSRRSRAVD